MSLYTVGQVVTEKSTGLFDKSGRLHETNPAGFDLTKWERGCTTRPIVRTMTVTGERYSRISGIVPVVKYTEWTAQQMSMEELR